MNGLLETAPATEVEVERKPASVCVAQPRRLDPLLDSGWDALLAPHPRSSFFHGSAWARVLHDTYGHRPVYLSRRADGKLEDLLPIMEVSSLWTGRRGVSLPFTDFCAPLKTRDESVRPLFQQAIAYGRERGWRYFECRSSDYQCLGGEPSLVFYGHVIDLKPGPAALFKNLDGSVRRAIRKAEDARLQMDFSHSPEAIHTFYTLHCQTRHRHGLPPQPFRFFDNIARHVLAPGHGFIATARLQGQPVSAAVFFHDARHVIYKFGASDFAAQHLRPNNLVMWEAIKWCAGHGFERLHLGRTSLTNEGLRRFKLGFGACEERIEYFRYDFLKRSFVTQVDRAEGWFNRVFRCLPRPVLRLAGQMLYPHLS